MKKNQHCIFALLCVIFCLFWFNSLNRKLQTANDFNFEDLEVITSPSDFTEPKDFRSALSYLDGHEKGVELVLKLPEGRESIKVGNALDTYNPDGACHNSFDFGFIKAWISDRYTRTYCKNIFPSYKWRSEVTCYKITQDWLNAVTTPHVFCDGTNIFLNPNFTRPATCLKHRPHYKCAGSKTYRQYDKGAFSAVCQPVWRLKLDFSGDHHQDMFDSFVGINDPNQISPSLVMDDRIVILMAREKGEHDTFFHNIVDWFMLFQLMHMKDLDFAHVQLMFLDDHPPTHFDEATKNWFSPNYPILRWNDLNGQTLMQRVIFSYPHYTSILFARVTEECPGQCCKKLEIMEHFCQFILKRNDLKQNSKILSPFKLKILFVKRDEKWVNNIIANPDDLMDIMQKNEHVTIEKVDFRKIDLSIQLALVSSSDILIGMHGGGLAHCLFLPNWGGILEIFSSTDKSKFTMNHLAKWRGLFYNSFHNTNTVQQKKFNVINVNLFEETFKQIVGEIWRKKWGKDLAD